MPRVKDGVERMTSDEIDAIAKQAKAEMKAEAKAPKKALVTEGAKPLESNANTLSSVGLGTEKKATPDSAIESKFKFTPCSKKGWIPMTDEEALEYSNLGVLIGHDPAKKIGLIQRD